MSDIEERIVSIKFDNTNFERNIASTIAALDKLRDSLDFSGLEANLAGLSDAVQNVDLSSVGAGLGQITDAANQVDLSNISAGVDNISSKFSAMGAIGFAAIQKLTHGVLNFGAHMIQVGKEDLLGPIISGGTKRAGNIEHAKFMFEGLGIDVQKGMDSALQAVLGTAYGLGDAAKAAAQFGASGIKVGKEMTGALRGVAGAAAMTGSSFTEMADIFAGSAGTGRVTNQDLMQFATRGLNAAAAIAPILHTTEAGIHEMATKGTLDFKTFASAMDQAFGKHATEANKTYEGSLANMHAAMSRLGASFFTPKMEQQRDLFNAITPVIDNVTKALKPVIMAFIDWRRVGIDKIIERLKQLNFTNFIAGMEKIGYAIRDTIFSLSKVMKTVQVAFRDIFPKQTTSNFLSIAESVRLMARWFTLVALKGENLEKLRQIFAGIFAVVDIGWNILKNVVRLFFDLFKAVAPVAGTGGGGLLTFAASIGTALVKLDAFLVKGGKLSDFFDAVAKVITPPINFIKDLVGALIGLARVSIPFAAIGERIKNAAMVPVNALKSLSDSITGAFSTVSNSTPVENTMDRVSQRVKQVQRGMLTMEKFFIDIRARLGKIAEWIGFYTQQLREKIANIWGPADFKPALDAVNTGFFGALIFMFARLMRNGLQIQANLGAAFNKTIAQLGEHLKALTLQVKVNLLLKIAAAVAILTVSMIALSLLDSAALTRSLVAISTGMGSLVASLVLLDKNITSGAKSGKIQNSGPAKMMGLSAVLMSMATAMLILSGAMVILGKLNPEELGRGILGITAGIGVMVGAMVLITKNLTKPKIVAMTEAGKTMVLMAGSLVILAKAVQMFAAMSWSEFANGMTRIVIGLAAIVGALRLMPENGHIMAAAAAVGILAFSLSLFAGTIILYNRIPFKTLIGGTLKVAVALGAIGLAMRAFPDQGHLIAASVAMLAVSVSLLLMAKAIKSLAAVKGGDLAKSVFAFSTMLGVLALALMAFNKDIVGAAALVLIAGGLLVLANAIEKLSKIKGGDLAKGVGAMVIVIGALAGVLALLSFILPSLAGLALVLLAVGASVALFGGGILALATGLAILSRTGPKGAQALVKVVKTFSAVLGSIIDMVDNALDKIFKIVLKYMPQILEIAGNLVIGLIEELIRLIPTLGEAFVTLIRTGLSAIVEVTPDIIATGLFILETLLAGIRDNMATIVTMVSDILVAFFNAMRDNSQRVIDAGTAFIVTFIIGITNSIQTIIDAGVWMITQLVQGFVDGATTVGRAITTAIQTLADEIGRNAGIIMEAGTRLVENLLAGGAERAERLRRAVVSFLRSIGDTIIGLTNDLARIAVQFMDGMADAIRRNGPNVRRSALNLAGAILDGLTFGLSSNMGGLINVGKNIGNSLLGAVGLPFRLGSPSKATFEMGQYLIEGLANGLKSTNSAEDAAFNMADRTIATFQRQLAKLNTLADIGEINPVITPVLDLSGVKAEARNLGTYLQASIAPDVSLRNARVISAESANSSDNNVPVAAGPTEIKFEQNNYSPKALSTNDIYRKTKSQIATAKEKLDIS